VLIWEYTHVVQNSIFFILRLFLLSSRRRHTRSKRDWSSDVCSSDLSNLWLIYQERFAPIIDRVHLVEENNAVSFLRPGQHQVDRLKEMKYLSFVAMTPITDLTLKNVVYPLDNYQMPTPLALISNEFLPDQNTMKIAFSNGLILAIQARD